MKYLLVALLACCCEACMAQQPVDNREKDIVFSDVNVIPMDREEVLLRRDVVVRNGIISAIEPHGSVKHDKNAVIIPASGKFLMPGLSEMHAHVPPVDDLEPMKDVLMLFVLNGVTTIRGMLGHPRHLELRRMIREHQIMGPHFITSGPSFNGNSVKTAGAGIAMVKDQKQKGYDFLKLHPGLTRENFQAIVAAAKEQGIPFAGHVSFDVGVWRAIAADYATIDHMDGFVESLIPGIDTSREEDIGFVAMFAADRAQEGAIRKLTDSLRAHQVWVVPTQALAERWFDPARSPESLAAEEEMKYMSPQTVRNWVTSKKDLMNNPKYNAATIKRLIEVRRKLIVACDQNGVGLLLGSDGPQVFNVPGFSVHHELQYLVDAGLSPYQALKTGTVNVAKFLKREDSGIIRKGAVSDLVLLKGNPLSQIGETRNIEGVMLGHQWLPRAYMDSQLQKAIKK